MYKHTTKSYKDVTNDVRNYIDHICRNSTCLEDAQDRIAIADANRQLHHYIRLFRNHAERGDHHTALIMLAITRNNVYKYVANALISDVDFNISEAARLLNEMEEYAHVLQVIDAAQP